MFWRLWVDGCVCSVQTGLCKAVDTSPRQPQELGRIAGTGSPPARWSQFWLLRSWQAKTGMLWCTTASWRMGARHLLEWLSASTSSSSSSAVTVSFWTTRVTLLWPYAVLLSKVPQGGGSGGQRDGKVSILTSLPCVLHCCWESRGVAESPPGLRNESSQGGSLRWHVGCTSGHPLSVTY